MEQVCFEGMSDGVVLERVEVLVARSNRLTAELLAYLAEVERRGLHLREATGSLFWFCVERLHMSESSAGKRVTAARTARRFPLIFEMIARGEIHLTGVNLLGAHLTEENHRELLARARHRSKREIEKLVAEIAPRPDAPSRVVALPRPVAAPALERAQEVHAPERAHEVLAREPAASPSSVATTSIVASVATAASARSAATVQAAPASVVQPLSPRRYQIRVTVGEETHAALCQLQDLLSHQVPDRDPAVILSLALDLLLERTLAKKVGMTDRPRAAKAPAEPANRSRHIPAAVRRAVWTRDDGRCAHVDGRGRRCSSTRFLQFHHLDNWARGADHITERIELRCRAHNQYQAVLDYGAAFMAAKKAAPPSGAKEPRAEYAVRRERASTIACGAGAGASARPWRLGCLCERARVGRGGGLRRGVPGVLAPHAAEGRAAARCQRREARTCEPKGAARRTFGERKRAPPEETSTASRPASERLVAFARRASVHRVQTSERAPRRLRAAGLDQGGGAGGVASAGAAGPRGAPNLSWSGSGSPAVRSIGAVFSPALMSISLTVGAPPRSLQACTRYLPGARLWKANVPSSTTA
jgi:hypothetical protein